MPEAFGVETIELDLPLLVGALSRRLHEAGVPVTPARSADFARALALRPADRAPSAVLDGARCLRVRPGAGERVRRGLLLRLRRRDDGVVRARRGAVRRGAAARSVDLGRRLGSGRRSIVASPAAPTATAPRSRCRWRSRATRRCCDARASMRSSRTSSSSSTG